MKKCSTCLEWKDEGEFNWRFALLGIRQSSCRECQHEHQARYYQRHKDNEKARTKERRNRVRSEAREYVNSVKSSSECVDCGEDDPRVLDFDHVRGKGKTVNRLVNEGASIDRIKAEINLTEVRCANCHRIKTEERRK
jgi:hypothetical protein